MQDITGKQSRLLDDAQLGITLPGVQVELPHISIQEVIKIIRAKPFPYKLLSAAGQAELLVLLFYPSARIQNKMQGHQLPIFILGHYTMGEFRMVRKFIVNFLGKSAGQVSFDCRLERLSFSESLTE